MQTGMLFQGDIAGCKAFLSARAMHYVYILRRPDGRPFYVGKGFGSRVFHHENEARHPNSRKSNAHKLNVIRSIWRSGNKPTYEIDLIVDNADEAYARETALISHFGRLHEGGPLTNRAGGGGSTSGLEPVSKAKHEATLSGAPSDNAERAILNQFGLGIAPMKSVVIKPISQFIARPTVRFPQSRRALTIRQAVALAASASANGIALDGECHIPRKLTVDGVDGLIENGVACDLLTSGTIGVTCADNAADEIFEVGREQAIAVVSLIGRSKAIDLGIVTDRTV